MGTISSVDSDNDGYTSYIDCNDNDPLVNPGVTEICDDVDNDCDGGIDEGFDADGDGYKTCAGDCNDNDPLVNPGATEICNGIDDNCAGGIDDHIAATPTTCGGIGECASTGTLSCVAGQMVDSCTPGQPLRVLQEVQNAVMV